jgi:hypothetical protein
MQFNYIMGHQKADTTHVWSLLGMDFVTPHASDNAPAMVSGWIAKHPNAMVIPVCAFGPPENINISGRLFIFCWVVDKKDTLNNYLVNNGCFPGGTMFAYDEWEKRNKTIKNAPTPKVYVYVSKNSYAQYQGQIVSNQVYARTHKLGLWSDKEYYKIKQIEEENRNK